MIEPNPNAELVTASGIEVGIVGMAKLSSVVGMTVPGGITSTNEPMPKEKLDVALVVVERRLVEELEIGVGLEGAVATEPNPKTELDSVDRVSADDVGTGMGITIGGLAEFASNVGIVFGPGTVVWLPAISIALLEGPVVGIIEMGRTTGDGTVDVPRSVGGGGGGAGTGAIVAISGAVELKATSGLEIIVELSTTGEPSTEMPPTPEAPGDVDELISVSALEAVGMIGTTEELESTAIGSASMEIELARGEEVPATIVGKPEPMFVGWLTLCTTSVDVVIPIGAAEFTSVEGLASSEELAAVDIPTGEMPSITIELVVKELGAIEMLTISTTIELVPVAMITVEAASTTTELVPVAMTAVEAVSTTIELAPVALTTLERLVASRELAGKALVSVAIPMVEAPSTTIELATVALWMLEGFVASRELAVREFVPRITPGDEAPSTTIEIAVEELVSVEMARVDAPS